MECLGVRASMALTRLPARLHRTLPLLQKRTFKSVSSFQAHSTTSAPETTSTITSYPRSEAAALLGLDTPSPSEREKARARDALRESSARLAAGQSSREKAAAAARTNRNMERLLSRKWQVGDVYTPHDLTPREIMEFRNKKKPSKDVFDALGINPLDMYKNPVLLAEFMTSGGRIKHPRETGLRPVNQRKIAKAIRRAIGMGLMPSCHVHPEMLRRRGPDSNTVQYQWH